MNVLFICDEYPPGKNGGVGTVVQLLSRELVKQGHKVVVAGLYSHTYGQNDFEIDEGVMVWRLRYGFNFYLGADHIFHKIFNKIPDIIKGNLNGKKAYKKFINFLNQLIHKEQIDIIEIPDWNTFAMRIGFKVEWPKFQVPLVLKSHGSYTYFAKEMNEHPKTKLVEIDRALFNRADALSAVSAYTAKINKDLFQVNEIKVLHNAIPIPASIRGIERLPNKVVFTGTLIKKKGIFQLLKAWNKIHLLKPEAELNVFGKGHSEELKNLLSHSALTTVFFKGHVAREKLFEELSLATLAVFPSYSETFGLAVIEAMSVGCPVIFTKRSCGPEIVTDGYDGALVDPDNLDEMSTTIINLLENTKLQVMYATNAAQTVSTKFNIVTSAQEHIAYYTEVKNKFKKTTKEHA